MPTTILIIALVLLLFIAAIVLFRTLRMLKPQPMVESYPAWRWTPPPLPSGWGTSFVVRPSR